MMVYSEEGNKLNKIDVLSLKYKCTTCDYTMDTALFSVVGRKILNDEIYYMIVPISHYYNIYQYETGNYDGPSKFEVYTSRRAIDVTEWELEKLEDSELIYWKEWRNHIDDLLLCRDGYYDDTYLFPFSRYTTPHFGTVGFCRGDGVLCSLQSDFILGYIENDGKVLCYASKTDRGLLRFTKGVVYTVSIQDNFTIGKELSYMSLLWYRGLECVGLENKYNGLKEIEALVNIIEDSDIDISDRANIFGSLSYRIYSNIGNYINSDEDRLNTFVHNLFVHYEPLIKIGDIFHNNNFKQDINFNGKSLSFELRTYDLIDDIDKNYLKKHSIDSHTYKGGLYFIEGDELCFRGAIEAVYNSNCVYCTIRYNIKTNNIRYTDIKIYDYTSDYWLSNKINSATFGASYYYLTGDNTYYNDEEINLRRIDSIDGIKSQNEEKLDELSIDCLFNYMQSLGYVKRTSKTIPDVAFMSLHKSAWLNDNEFVSLRQYSGSGKVLNLLDMYKGGKYLGSLSGDFKEDILDRILKVKEIDNSVSGNTVVKVSKVIADQYNTNGRNSISYDDNELFMDYAKTYILYAHKGEVVRSGDVITRVAKLKSTNEYCIIMQIIEYTTSNKTKGLNYILFRFNTEKDMFKVFTELFKKRGSTAGVFNKDNCLLSYLGVGEHECAIQTFNALNNRGKRYKYQSLLVRVVLKHLGFIPDASWRDVCFDVPDELYNLMIFD